MSRIYRFDQDKIYTYNAMVSYYEITFSEEAELVGILVGFFTVLSAFAVAVSLFEKTALCIAALAGAILAIVISFIFYVALVYVWSRIMALRHCGIPFHKLKITSPFKRRTTYKFPNQNVTQ